MQRYWRYIVVALTLLTTITALGYIGMHLGQELLDVPERHQPDRESHAKIEPRSANGAKTFEPNCGSPRTHDEAGICAQWVSIAKAEESNRLAQLNVRVSFFEAVGVIFSLAFTGWAAIAATRGNKAANRSIAQAEEHTRIGLRAYLGINPASIRIIPLERDGSQGKILVFFKCRVKNTGSTPAEDISAGADIKAISWPPKSNDEFLYTGAPECLSSGDIGREDEGTFQFTKALTVDFDRLAQGQDRIILTGRLIYNDIWKRPHDMEFQGSIIGIAPMMDVFKRWAPGSTISGSTPDTTFSWYQPNRDARLQL